ncbi:hypothetical protein [Ruegeria sp. MALMAid1280]|uniref:hypothetical protein n=1 Tax=Ruegeria sp. MALMAid1280 TaxID=3411634 RepID=UPI003B9E12AB
MGDRCILRLLVTGMTARLRQMKAAPDRVDPWAIDLLTRKPPATGNSRNGQQDSKDVWAVLTKNEYHRPHYA